MKTTPNMSNPPPPPRKKSLEQIHISAIEEAIELLTDKKYTNGKLIGKLNRTIGYLLANEEIINENL